MTEKFPLWMSLALVVALGLTTAFTGFGWMLSHAFTGTSSLGLFKTVLLYAPPVVTLICAVLAYLTWQSGSFVTAKCLAIAPLPLLAAVFALVGTFGKMTE